MATYENCYEILDHLRYGINEHSSGFMAGTDTTCPHSNSYLVKKINVAQRQIYNILLRRIKGEFLETASLTGVSSVYTLPADFGILVHFKDDNGLKVHQIPPSRKHTTNATGFKRLYYRKGQTLVLDKDGITATYTLEYYRKPRELDQGATSAGAATSATLATTAKGIVDYYNGMKIENITDSTVDEISDYTAARVATVTNIWAASKTYGIVSDIPEPFHHLIGPKAVHLTKAESPVIQEKPTASEVSEWNSQLIDALRAYAGTDLDEDPASLFEDFGPHFPASGIVNV